MQQAYVQPGHMLHTAAKEHTTDHNRLQHNSKQAKCRPCEVHEFYVSSQCTPASKVMRPDGAKRKVD
jgi:hypothetical protein